MASSESAERKRPLEPSGDEEGNDAKRQRTAEVADLGCFSVSLAVQDLERSKQFYTALGFEVGHSVPGEKWLIMKNGTTNIGLFEKMFEQNMLTFNPGWTHDAQPLEHFDDVRDIQKRALAAGVEVKKKAEGESGPASMVVVDPDGNTILFDQHV